jgi:hypothetical protein
MNYPVCTVILIQRLRGHVTTLFKFVYEWAVILSCWPNESEGSDDIHVDPIWLADNSSGMRKGFGCNTVLETYAMPAQNTWKCNFTYCKNSRRMWNIIPIR